MTTTETKPPSANRFKQHYEMMTEIIGKILNDTFFGLGAVVCILLALWVFPMGFFRSCCICLALIFAIFFYVATIVRVAQREHARWYSKRLWLTIVVVVPVVGGLSFYYLRLISAYLPASTRRRLKQPSTESAGEPAPEEESENSFSDSFKSINFSAAEGVTPV
jgi:hypothetical protein